MRNHSVLIEQKTKRAKNDEQKDMKIVFKERDFDESTKKDKIS